MPSVGRHGNLAEQFIIFRFFNSRQSNCRLRLEILKVVPQNRFETIDKKKQILINSALIVK